MKMNSLVGKRVTVMGLGGHGGGVGTVAWLLQQGALVLVTDMKPEEELADSVEKIRALEGGDLVEFVLGEHREEDFTGVDMVVRNPGVRADSTLLVAARGAGVLVEMDSSLFFAYCPSGDIIGVTGSKGKTTCARAIEWVLGEGPKKVVAVGVDGVSPLGMLAAGEINAQTTVVFELSSWRLEALAERAISPPVAVVTSIYKEHLNTYGSFEEYIETKKAIWKSQGEDGLVLLNADDEIIRSWAGEVGNRVRWLSTEGEIEGEGVFVRDGMIWVRDGVNEVELMSLAALPLQGEHERRNLLPALLLGRQRGMSPDRLREIIAGFQRLHHRLEVVRELDGVTYVNDSAATMPDASMAALKTYADVPVVLIAGGNDKDLEFEEWARVVGDTSVKAIVWLPGTATSRMQAALGSVIEQREATSMEEAVSLAQGLAERGDAVLLSPGATSFGLFKHEFDRGEKFREAVASLTV